MRHYEEIHSYVTDIDTKQKELQDQIDNFHLNLAAEYCLEHHRECDEQRDFLLRLVADLRVLPSPRTNATVGRGSGLSASVRPRRFQPPGQPARSFSLLGSNAMRESPARAGGGGGEASSNFSSGLARDVAVSCAEEANGEDSPASVARSSREQKPRLEALHNEIRQHKDR
jgi:hypothetical protein